MGNQTSNGSYDRSAIPEYDTALTKGDIERAKHILSSGRLGINMDIVLRRDRFNKIYYSKEGLFDGTESYMKKTYGSPLLLFIFRDMKEYLKRGEEPKVLDFLDWLIAHGANVSDLFHRNYDSLGESIIKLAISNDASPAIIRKLLQFGAEPDSMTIFKELFFKGLTENAILLLLFKNDIAYRETLRESLLANLSRGTTGTRVFTPEELQLFADAVSVLTPDFTRRDLMEIIDRRNGTPLAISPESYEFVQEKLNPTWHRRKHAAAVWQAMTGYNMRKPWGYNNVKPSAGAPTPPAGAVAPSAGAPTPPAGAPTPPAGAVTPSAGAATGTLRRGGRRGSCRGSRRRTTRKRRGTRK